MSPCFPSLPKGAGVLLRASDIYTARSNMLAAQDLGEERFCLSQRAAALMADFHTWLTTNSPLCYCGLTTDAQRTWLSQVTLLAVVWYVMEEKCSRFLMEGRTTFSDRWVSQVMGHLRVYHHLTDEAALLIERIVEEPEHWNPLIACFLKEMDIHMWGYPFVQPDPLLPLSTGVSFSFVLPMLPVQRRTQQKGKA